MYLHLGRRYASGRNCRVRRRQGQLVFRGPPCKCGEELNREGRYVSVRCAVGVRATLDVVRCVESHGGIRDWRREEEAFGVAKV